MSVSIQACISCVFIFNLNVIVGIFGFELLVAFADAEGSDGAIWSEDETSLLRGGTWGLCQLSENIVFVVIVEVLSPEFCVFLDRNSYFFVSCTISIQEICNEIVPVLSRFIRFCLDVVCAVSSDRALFTSCIRDFKCFFRPLVEIYQFDSCVGFSLDFLVILIGFLLPFVGIVEVAPHFAYI